MALLFLCIPLSIAQIDLFPRLKPQLIEIHKQFDNKSSDLFSSDFTIESLFGDWKNIYNVSQSLHVKEITSDWDYFTILEKEDTIYLKELQPLLPKSWGICHEYYKFFKDAQEVFLISQFDHFDCTAKEVSKTIEETYSPDPFRYRYFILEGQEYLMIKSSHDQSSRVYFREPNF